jgi:hypothetical protein
VFTLEWPAMEYVIVAFLSLIGGWFGGFFGSYMKKKGENLATHEDIDKVVDQVRAVTQATKTIENKLSGELWDKQKQWEMKKEVLFEMTRRVADLDAALRSVYSTYETEAKEIREKGGGDWLQTKHEAVTSFNSASNAYDQQATLAAIVCSKETNTVLRTFGSFADAVCSKVVKGEPDYYKVQQRQVFGTMLFAQKAIRQELGVDSPTPQSNESLAVPTPAPPSPPAK